MFEDETPLFCADDVFDDEPVPLELDDEPLEPVPLDDVLDEPFEVLLLDVVPLDDVLPLLEAEKIDFSKVKHNQFARIGSNCRIVV